MLKWFKSSQARLVLLTLLVFGSSWAMVGCPEQDNALEDAADSIEEGVEEVGDEIDDATTN